MKTKTLLLLITAVLLVAGVQISPGATVPAGTVLIVRTLRSVSSVDVPGTPVPAQLLQPVTINGKVAIPAGTHFSGKVVTSRRLASSNTRLTVNLTSVHVGGGDLPITTAGAQLLSNDLKTRSGVGVSRTDYTVASGKQIQFKLARPLVL